MNIPNHRLSHPWVSPALIVAILALIVALGGSAMAVNAAKNSVTSKSIRNGAVKTKKLAEGAVVSTKLGPDAVTPPAIADGAVGAAAIAPDAVNGARIANGAVGSDELAADAVTGQAIDDGAVDNADIADEAVSVGKIEPGAIQASRFYEATAVQVNFPSIAGSDCTVAQPAGFENLQSSDRLLVSAPASLAAPLILKAAADQGGLTLTMCNLSGVAVDPPSLAYRVLVIR